MTLNIPKRMKERLEQDSGINSFTLTSVNNLKPWLDANTTVFFPEYTDHSFVHLNEVLATAESIITDESWDTITPEDVSAMIVSVLLHDCAMHITEDGFYSLIKDIYPPIKSQYVSTEPKWSLMWSEYIAEAKRFNSDKLKSIFNDTKPINDIPEDKLYLSTKDKLLIGEFIRRHHARIAHEIVFNGVPGTERKTLKLAEAQKPHFLDLCGFIAKSHNMSLRQAVDKIQYRKKRVHLNTHVPFLMSVLRISDYIQVQATRAPSQLLNVKSLISPISKGEWKKHDAILEISHADEDPEALFIDAEPQNAIIFEDLRWLFGDIQRELDEVWAVLGEVYGRYDEMANLGINIRRLRSSLDDINEYTRNKKPDFIPKVLNFRTADSEMMELLIAPLYGDKPEIGIRELVQNSVDACLERDDIINKRSITFDKPNDYDVCVSVIEYEDYGEVVIEDYGVGMTLDIVENYFLNIGASFRNSDRWKKAHETEGNSDINRTGRFGIGLLAAYLLGDELEVETRHVDCLESQGLKFRCSRGSKSVTISHISCHIGTKISIKVSKSIVEYLVNDTQQWDWYCLESPKLERVVVTTNEVKKSLSQKVKVPQCISKSNSSDWHEISTPSFRSIIWSHEEFNTSSNTKEPILICNGIFVSKVKDSYYYHYRENDYLCLPWRREALLIPNTPTVAVFDNNGELPLNIQRTDLTSGKLDFLSPLAKDISLQVVRRFFNNLNNVNFKSFAKLTEKITAIKDLGWSRAGWGHKDNLSYLIFSMKGIMLLDKEHLIQAKPDSIQFIVCNNKLLNNQSKLNKFFTNFSYLRTDTSDRNERLMWVRNFFELRDGYKKENKYGKILYKLLKGSRVLIKKNHYKEICGPRALPATFRKELEIIWENKDWYLVENKIGDELPPFKELEELVAQLDKDEISGIIYHYFDWNIDTEIEEKDEYEFSIAEAWLELNDGKAYFKV